MSNQWADYVRSVTAGMTQTQIAQTTGVAQTAISRWLRGDTEAPRVEYVVAFARGLDLDCIEAIVAAGFITEREAKARVIRAPLKTYSTDELFQELRRRTIDGSG